MRASTLLTAAFAASAVAGPLQAEKRAYKYEVTWVTVTVTVTVDKLPAPTPAYEKPKVYPAEPKPKPTEPKEYPKPPASPPVYVAPKPQPTKKPAPAYVPPKPAYTPPKPAAPQNPPKPAGNDYKGNVLRHHNIHRANHSAPALVWDDKLASNAYALASTCFFKHDTSIGGGGYGQNLAASAPNANVTAQISEGWYNGEFHDFDPYYGVPNPASNKAAFKRFGHFSQMVWKGTKKLGCATYDCTRGGKGNIRMHYTVCNYSPPGNWAGQYHQQVGRPLGHPTCHWDD